MEKLIVSLSPHDHANDSVQRNMYAVLIALLLMMNIHRTYNPYQKHY